MKRNGTRLLLALAVLALLCGCVAAAQAATNHTHEWTLRTTRKEPTCTEKGKGLYVCS